MDKDVKLTSLQMMGIPQEEVEKFLGPKIDVEIMVHLGRKFGDLSASDTAADRFRFLPEIMTILNSLQYLLNVESSKDMFSDHFAADNAIRKLKMVAMHMAGVLKEYIVSDELEMRRLTTDDLWARAAAELKKLTYLII